MLWVAGRQIDPGDDHLNGTTTPWVTDGDIRSYVDWAEANAHAAGTTDHLGHLVRPANVAGTWMRFDTAQLNVLGEDHTLIDLVQVRTSVVGANAPHTRFTYEPFATDALTPGSHLKAVYDAENAAELQACGIQAVANKRPYGGESLYPKIGFMMVMASQALNGPLADLRSANGYLGHPLQRYLKLAWAYAKDVAAEVAAANLAGHLVPASKDRLARKVASHTATLDAWMVALPVDGWIGDALNPLPNAQIVPALLKVAEAVEAAILDRLPHDTVLLPAERTRVGAMPRFHPMLRLQQFLEWRDLNFMHVVQAAAAAGDVRYSGMGSRHLNYLLAAPGRFHPNARAFYMDGRHLHDFASETALLHKRSH